MSKMVVIFRGLPGSWLKSRAEHMANLQRAEGRTVFIACANDFFVNDGEHYEFDYQKLPAAHEWCKQIFASALGQGIHIVIVVNTNTKMWEMKPYVKMAEEHNYPFMVVTLQSTIGQALDDNPHDVDVEDIENMFERLMTEELPPDWPHEIIDV